MMEVIVQDKFELMIETAELVCAYFNHIDPTEMTLDEPGCIPAKEIARMMEQVCIDMNREDPKLQFFFRGYESPKPDKYMPRLCCLATILCHSRNKSGISGMGSFREAMHSCYLGQGKPYEIISCVKGLGVALCDEYRPLTQELKKINIHEELRLNLAVALTNYHDHVDWLCDILEPLADRLSALLAPWEEKLRRRAQQWRQSLDTEEKQNRLIGKVNNSITKRKSLTVTFSAFYPCSHTCIHDFSGNFWFTAGLAILPGGTLPVQLSDRVLEAMQLMSNWERLRILRLLVGRKMLPKEIVKELGLNRGTVFRDLNNLLQVHLVELVSRDGEICYTTNPERMTEVMAQIQQFVLSEDKH